DLSLKSVPAFSMSNPYTYTSTSAIASNAFATFTSSSVHVGDLNNNVSDTIADNSNNAFVLEISTSFSLKILYKSVAVHPTGSARKYNGSCVSKFAIRW